MTERKALHDPNEPPEDVASLYSWANLHGAKYRDFSASRAQSREKARQRVQQAAEDEREQGRRQAGAQRAEKVRLAAEAAHAEEQARLNVLAAEQAVQIAAQQAALQAAQEAAREARAAQAQAAQYAQQAECSARQQALPERFATAAPPQPEISGYSMPQPFRPASAPPRIAPMHEQISVPPATTPWAPPESREFPGSPAWLASRPKPAPPPPVSQSSEDTLQGSRDRITSRWFALKGLFDPASSGTLQEAQPAPVAARVPVIGVFSLAGGVGKTSLLATLGRALSSRGERVLLVDTAAFGLLPFFFGARDQRPGQLRTFSPPAASGDAPIQMVAIDPESLGPENAAQEVLAGEISKYTRGVSRVLIDLATASGTTTRRILKLSPMILIPVVPDMNSVVSVSSIDAFFEHNGDATGRSSLPYYVLNRFDPSLPLHLDVREVLREQLGDRLLSFALRRSPAVSEALAEGMTVMDYAPNSTIAEDFGSLAGWVKNQSAPASSGFRGVRWSER